MEVGEHGVNDTKAVAGQDEEPGPPLPGGHSAFCCGTLEYPDRGCTDRDDASPLPTRLIDRVYGPLVNPVPLAMDSVLCRIFDADGPEGIETDVQRHEGDPHPAIADRRQQPRREVKARGRRRRRAFLACVDRLIPLAIPEPFL